MKGENLDSLAILINSVISKNSPGNPVSMNITNPTYRDTYLKIFMDEVERNNGEPIHYEKFGNRLWIKLNKDVDCFKKEADEFTDVWNGWYHLYTYLKRNNKLR